jgi:hypothetical protein
MVVVVFPAKTVAMTRQTDKSIAVLLGTNAATMDHVVPLEIFVVMIIAVPPELNVVAMYVAILRRVKCV